MPQRLLIICLLLFFFGEGSADARRSSKNIQLFFSGSFDYGFANSTADTITGATYSKNYKHPMTIAGQFGLLFHNILYVGLRYEYWLANREFTLGGSAEIDTLHYQTAGLELGLYASNPRIFYMILGSAHYPLQLEVANTGTNPATYTNSANPLAYQVRGLMGVKFSRRHAFFLEGGYRFSNLGRLRNGTIDYPTDETSLDLNLSGPFLGIGLLFSL